MVGGVSVVVESSSSPLRGPMSLFRPRLLLVQSQEIKKTSHLHPHQPSHAAFTWHRPGICKLDMCAASVPRHLGTRPENRSQDVLAIHFAGEGKQL